MDAVGADDRLLVSRDRENQMERNTKVTVWEADQNGNSREQEPLESGTRTREESRNTRSRGRGNRGMREEEGRKKRREKRREKKRKEGIS